MKVGLAAGPVMRAAIADLGARPWSTRLRLRAGDVLIVDADLPARALRHVRGLLLLDVEVIVVGEGTGGPWPWRRLRLAEGREELAALRGVHHATALTPITGHLQPVTLRLEVRDGDHGGLCLPNTTPISRDLRVAFHAVGLPWPQRSALTVSWDPLRPAAGEVSLALAAALLAAAHEIDPDLLRRCVFLGDVAPDGTVRAPATLPAHAHRTDTAGVRHLLAPGTIDGTRATVHSIATVAELPAVLRPLSSSTPRLELATASSAGWPSARRLRPMGEG